MKKRYFNVETRHDNGNFAKWMDTIEGEEAAQDQMLRLKKFAEETGVDFQSTVRLRELVDEEEIKRHIVQKNRHIFLSHLMRKSQEDLEAIVDSEKAPDEARWEDRK